MNEHLNAYYATVEHHIGTTGWALQAVVDPQGQDPPFVYSAGLCLKGLPELLMKVDTAPEVPLASQLLNATAATLLADPTHQHSPSLDVNVDLEGPAQLRVRLTPQQDTTDLKLARWVAAISTTSPPPVVTCLLVTVPDP